MKARAYAKEAIEKWPIMQRLLITGETATTDSEDLVGDNMVTIDDEVTGILHHMTKLGEGEGADVRVYYALYQALPMLAMYHMCAAYLSDREPLAVSLCHVYLDSYEAWLGTVAPQRWKEDTNLLQVYDNARDRLVISLSLIRQASAVFKKKAVARTYTNTPKHAPNLVGARVGVANAFTAWHRFLRSTFTNPKATYTDERDTAPILALAAVTYAVHPRFMTADPREGEEGNEAYMSDAFLAVLPARLRGTATAELHDRVYKAYTKWGGMFKQTLEGIHTPIIDRYLLTFAHVNTSLRNSVPIPLVLKVMADFDVQEGVEGVEGVLGEIAESLGKNIQKARIFANQWTQYVAGEEVKDDKDDEFQTELAKAVSQGIESMLGSLSAAEAVEEEGEEGVGEETPTGGLGLTSKDIKKVTDEYHVGKKFSHVLPMSPYRRKRWAVSLATKILRVGIGMRGPRPQEPVDAMALVSAFRDTLVGGMGGEVEAEVEVSPVVSEGVRRVQVLPLVKEEGGVRQLVPPRFPGEPLEEEEFGGGRFVEEPSFQRGFVGETDEGEAAAFERLMSRIEQTETDAPYRDAPRDSSVLRKLKAAARRLATRWDGKLAGAILKVVNLRLRRLREHPPADGERMQLRYREVLAVVNAAITKREPRRGRVVRL